MSTLKDRQKRRTRIAFERIDETKPPPEPTVEDIRERLKNVGALRYLCLEVPRTRQPSKGWLTLLSRSGPTSDKDRPPVWDGRRGCVTAYWSVKDLRAWAGVEPLAAAYEALADIVLGPVVTGHEWTGDDAAFVGRVDVAVEGLDIPAAAVEEWQECCRKWGPRSRSALGCLLGFVRVARDQPLAAVRYSDSMSEWACEADIMNGWRHWRSTEDEALLAALEGATR